MSERERRIAILKAEIALAKEKKKVYRNLAAYGGAGLVSGALSLINPTNPVLIGSTLLLSRRFMGETQELDRIGRQRAFLKERDEGPGTEGG